MFLELTLWNQEQYDEADRLIVQSIEIDPFSGSSKRSDHFIDQIR